MTDRLSPMLVTSSRDPYTLAPMLLSHLRGTIEIEEFFEKEGRYDARLVERVFRRLTRNRSLRIVNESLIRHIRSKRFKSLWVFKGMNLLPETLSLIRGMGVKLINYNADHPLEHFKTGSGNRRVIDSYDLFDLHLTYSREIQKQLLEFRPDIPVAVIPFGHNVDDSQYLTLQHQPETVRCCFIGNPDPERASFLQKLSAQGVDLDIYGANWNRYLTPRKHLRIFGIALGPKYFNCLRTYRVQLNLLRPHNRNSHNMRSFEIPACGGIMLAPQTVEHSDFFRSGTEAFYYNSVDQAVQQCKTLLDLSKEDADVIRNNARHRSVSSAYSYRDRAFSVLRICHAARELASPNKLSAVEIPQIPIAANLELTKPRNRDGR